MDVYLYQIITITIYLNYLHQDTLGDHIYEVVAFNARERKFLYELHMWVDDFNFMNGVTNEAGIPMYVMTSEQEGLYWEKFMHDQGIQCIKYPDSYELQPVNTSSEHELEEGIVDNGTGNLYKFQYFPSWSRIQRWFKAVQTIYPRLSAEPFGKTADGNELMYFKLSKASSAGKCAVFIMSGEEGRDWLSPAITMNVIMMMLKYQDGLKKLTDFYDFYFVPLLNPDGYQYSLEHHRYWSKNRKRLESKEICHNRLQAVGINIDRNWFFEPEPQTDLYDCWSVNPGCNPLSEEETHGAAELLSDIAPTLMAFINLKGFANMITVPYGYTRDHPNNYPVLMEMLESVHRTLYDKFNVTYDIGSTASLMYNLSGNVADWVKKELNVPLVYTVYMKYNEELVPDVSHVQPLSEQFVVLLEGLLTIAREIYGPVFDGAHRIEVEFKLLIPFVSLGLL